MGFLSTKKNNVSSADSINTESFSNGGIVEATSTHLGKSVKIKGSITAREDMTVEGVIEGDINIDKVLTIERAGNVKADIKATTVRIKGRVNGKITASERIEILDSGVCEGDINAKKLVVKEGAILLGNVNLEYEDSVIAEEQTDESQKIEMENENEIVEGEVIEKEEEIQGNPDDTDITEEENVEKTVTIKKKSKKSKRNKKKK